jgi:hypothetical protein
VRDCEKEIEQAWAKSGFNAAERSKINETHVWYHTTDVSTNGNGGVKMILVPNNIHDATEGGYNHTGGRAVIEFLVRVRPTPNKAIDRRRLFGQPLRSA